MSQNTCSTRSNQLSSADMNTSAIRWHSFPSLKFVNEYSLHHDSKQHQSKQNNSFGKHLFFPLTWYRLAQKKIARLFSCNVYLWVRPDTCYPNKTITLNLNVWIETRSDLSEPLTHYAESINKWFQLLLCLLGNPASFFCIRERREEQVQTQARHWQYKKKLFHHYYSYYYSNTVACLVISIKIKL